MKKPHMIIGKKQLILAGMTLILGAAIYVNYAVGGVGIRKTEKIENQAANYGEAQLVSENSASDDYFAKARIDRMNSRDKAAETLKNIIGGGDSTKEEQSVAEKDAATMSDMVEKESKIENLIKAEGFKDCVVYLDGERASIVVKSDGLTDSDAAKIKEILLSEVEIDNENIKIIDVK
ncbi:MAG: SpoIIIAH-like family protein [Oscillospiraceae bacterium]